MVRLIEQTLKPLIEAQGYIGQYGGIVQAVTLKRQGEFIDILGREFESGKIYDVTLPVSCYLSAQDCFDGGKYFDLVPDDKYSSVAYFEQRGSSALSTAGPNQREWTFQEELRFVCWLNYPKLGLSDCKGPERFALAFLSSVMNSRTFTVDGISGRLDINNARLLPRDFRQVFGRYSYSDKQHVFFSPYDFFAVDLTARVHINRDCLADVTLGDEITCVTTYL